MSDDDNPKLDAKQIALIGGEGLLASVRGAHGRDTHERVCLFDLGKFFVKWVLR